MATKEQPRPNFGHGYTGRHGIRVYSIKSDTTYNVLARLSPLGQPCLVANFKQAGTPLPKGVRAEDDLFAKAPEEIRREHSLHLIGSDDAAPWLEVFENLRGRDALAVMFTKKPREELLQGLRPYWGWYSKPQTVKMVFEQGPENLAKGLMTGVEAVLLEIPAEKGWLLYVRPGVELNWEQIMAEG
jgi:hypothetical protein